MIAYHAMTTQYTYVIKVEFDKCRRECQYKNIQSKYIGCQGNSDLLHFYKKSLKIIATRKMKYEDGTILSSSTNTLNAQLLKGLLFYYAISNDLPNIKNISIELYSNSKHIYSYKECLFFEQPLHSNKTKHFKFLPHQIEIIFDTSQKSSAIRIALSYWLKAIDSNSSYLKFDYLWRSFGRIYLYHANTVSDNIGQREIKKLIISSSTKFGNSIAYAKRINLRDIEMFRWRKLILHDYDTPNKMPALRDFIQRYSDNRIMHAINHSISVRLKYLSNYTDKTGRTQDLWTKPNGVEAWIHKNLNTTNDVEIITIVCIKYAYFLRNQYFHGEIPENTFRVQKSSEDQERELINQLLECLVYELIINNNLLRI